MAPPNKCFLVMFMPYALFSVPTGGFIRSRSCTCSEFQSRLRFIGKHFWSPRGTVPVELFMQSPHSLYAEMTSDRRRLGMRTHLNAGLALKFKFAKWGQISVACRRGGNEWNWPYEMAENDFRKQNYHLCMRMQATLPLMRTASTRFRFDNAGTRADYRLFDNRGIWNGERNLRLTVNFQLKLCNFLLLVNLTRASECHWLMRNSGILEPI